MKKRVVLVFSMLFLFVAVLSFVKMWNYGSITGLSFINDPYISSSNEIFFVWFLSGLLSSIVSFLLIYRFERRKKPAFSLAKRNYIKLQIDN